MGSGLIYSANVGGYDSPKAMPFDEEGVDYVLYGDTDAFGWHREAIPSNFDRTRPVFMARQIKVMIQHLQPGYDWYLWLDATMQQKEPLLPLIEKLLESEHDFAAFKHNEWQCAYTEVDKCIERKKDTAEKLFAARGFLQSNRFPKNFGQLASGVLFRKSTELTKKHAIAWWEHMKATTLRDQCTFMLALWKLEAYIEWIPGLHTDNKWIDYRRGHLK